MLFVPLKLLSLTREAIISYFPDPTEIYCNKRACKLSELFNLYR